ncbi:hypothetical protein [Parablautia intestinalis]|nr:hypothetical protein [Parablautia intestinalis]
MSCSYREKKNDPIFFWTNFQRNCIRSFTKHLLTGRQMRSALRE